MVLIVCLYRFSRIGTVPYTFAFAHPFLHLVECFAESLEVDDFTFPQISKHIFDARVGTDGNEIFVRDARTLLGIDVGNKIGDRITQARYIDGLRKCGLAKRNKQRAVLLGGDRAYPSRTIRAFCHTCAYGITRTKTGRRLYGTARTCFACEKCTPPPVFFSRDGARKQKRILICPSFFVRAPKLYSAFGRQFSRQSKGVCPSRRREPCIEPRR